MGEYADMTIESQMWPGDAHWIDDEEQAEFFGFGEPRQKKPSGPGKCPKCGAETVLRTGKFGEFFGCTRFPKCKGSRDRGKT